MIRTFSVTFDCHDPARVAAFWAAALGYRVEEGPAVDAQGTAPWASIADPDGSRPPVFYQRVPEAKVAKNRVHLDVEVGGEGPLEDRRRRIEVERDRLVALGRRIGAAPMTSRRRSGSG